jgi:hypothetical protein
MSAIKGVVIGMGVLILVGFVVVAITLVTRSKGGSEAKDQFQNMCACLPEARFWKPAWATAISCCASAPAMGQSPWC